MPGWFDTWELARKKAGLKSLLGRDDGVGCEARRDDWVDSVHMPTDKPLVVRGQKLVLLVMRGNLIMLGYDGCNDAMRSDGCSHGLSLPAAISEAVLEEWL